MRYSLAEQTVYRAFFVLGRLTKSHSADRSTAELRGVADSEEKGALRVPSLLQPLAAQNLPATGIVSTGARTGACMGSTRQQDAQALVTWVDQRKVAGSV